MMPGSDRRHRTDERSLAHDSEMFTLLCTALSGERNASFDRAAELEAALADPARVAAMRRLAEAEGVLPAVYEALAVPRLTQIARSERIILATEYEANRRRNSTLRGVLLELGRMFSDAAIEVAPLKGGAWLMEEADGAAAWRFMLDLDIAIDRAHFDRLTDLMAQIAFAPYSRKKHGKGARNGFESPFWRSDVPALLEVHRDLGWRRELLPVDVLLGHSRPIASGLRMPAPWCRAFHCIVHWQIQDHGLSRQTVRLKDVLDVARFLARNDVDWTFLAGHARSVGAMKACEAAVAIAAELLAAPVPPELRNGKHAETNAKAALNRRASPLHTWLATQTWRAGSLWRCEKIRYRQWLRGASPARIRTVVWMVRVMRLPVILVRWTAICFRWIVLLLSSIRLPLLSSVGRRRRPVDAPVH